MFSYYIKFRKKIVIKSDIMSLIEHANENKEGLWDNTMDKKFALHVADPVSASLNMTWLHITRSKKWAQIGAPYKN